MSLNIKNEETVRLVRALADELGVSMTAAITIAVRARLADVQPAPVADFDIGAARALVHEMRLRMGDAYAAQDFDALLYDERGLPR